MAISIELRTKYFLETAGSERQKREREGKIKFRTLITNACGHYPLEYQHHLGPQ